MIEESPSLHRLFGLFFWPRSIPSSCISVLMLLISNHHHRGDKAASSTDVGDRSLDLPGSCHGIKFPGWTSSGMVAGENILQPDCRPNTAIGVRSFGQHVYTLLSARCSHTEASSHTAPALIMVRTHGTR